MEPLLQKEIVLELFVLFTPGIMEPHLQKEIVLRKAWRIENPAVWQQYMQRMAEIEEDRRKVERTAGPTTDGSGTS